MDSQIHREAVVSDDQKYRYTLYREWCDIFEPRRILNFVMLNPSTADGLIDDATVRKCMGFARLNGFNAIRVVNLFAYRATIPADMAAQYEAGMDIVGPDKDAYVRELPPEETVCVAWGSTFMNKPWVQKRVKKTLELLNRKLWCLGKTKDGHPRHPCLLGYCLLQEF